jgi:hypothetical protein
MNKNEVKRTRSKLLIVGGIIEIALAFVCMFFGVFVTSILLTGTYRYQDYSTHAQLQNSVGIVGLVAFALGFTGGIFAFKRQHLWFAVLGTFVTMFWAILFGELAMIATTSSDRLTGIMFSMFIFIFSIISLVFVALSRKEFKKEGVKL